jgi:hypothetical protein
LLLAPAAPVSLAEIIVAMPSMLSAGRPAVVVPRNRLLPAQPGWGGTPGYSRGSSGKWVRRADSAAEP